MSLNGLFLSFSALCDLKNTFFEKNSKIIFFEKKIFPNFSNSCSLNIFEPNIWRRLGLSRLVKIMNVSHMWFRHLRFSLVLKARASQAERRGLELREGLDKFSTSANLDRNNMPPFHTIKGSVPL